MDRAVHLTGQQRFFNLFNEKPLAPEISQHDLCEPVTRRLDGNDLHVERWPGRSEQIRHQFSLAKRKCAPPASDTESLSHFRALDGPGRTAPEQLPPTNVRGHFEMIA